MRRRAIVTGIVAVASAGFALPSMGGLPEVIRHALSSDSDDLAGAADDLEARYFLAPTTAFGPELLTQIMVLRQRITEHPDDRGAVRAAARLSLLYGLWSGNQGAVPNAQGWYTTAASLADRSGDAETVANVRGRAAARGAYEGWSVRKQRAAIAAVRAISTGPTPGLLDAYAAQIHLSALTGDLAGGREAVHAMWSVADALPVPDHAATYTARTAMFAAYLECRIGSPVDAARAYAAARPLLAATPLWLTDATIHQGRALVAAGDVLGGITLALEALRQYPADVSVRVNGVGVSDLLSVVPAGYDSADLAELRTYASAEPGPWETLR